MKAIKFPAFADKLLGFPLITRIKNLFQIAQETEEIFDGATKEEIIRQSIENGDIVFFNQMLCEIGELTFERILQRSSHRNDYLIYACKSVQNIFSPLLSDLGEISQDVCEAFGEYLFSRLTIHKLQNDILTVGESPFNEIFKFQGDDDEYFDTIMCWWSFMHTIKYMIDNFGPHQTFRAPKYKDIEFSDEITREVLRLNIMLELPPLIMNDIFRESYLENVYTVTFHGYKILAIIHMFGMSTTSIHMLHLVEKATNNISDLCRVKNVDNLYLDFPILHSKRSNTFGFNHAGYGVFSGPNTYSPIRENIKGDNDIFDFYNFLKIRIMHKIFELYQHLFDQIKDQRLYESDTEYTKLYLPENFVPFKYSDNSQQIEVPTQEIKDAVDETQVCRNINFPAMTSSEILKSLKKLGCKVIRQNGSHMCIQGPNERRQILPDHNTKIIGIGLVVKLLKNFGLSREAFVDNL